RCLVGSEMCIRDRMKEIQKGTGIKGKNLWMPIRVMLTGQAHGPELPKTAEILGREKCRRFVRESLERGGDG
ncbi:MAG: hypothetical protein QUS35_09380, partial [bacterium]|nr:hypothetical protein [bacterium]